ncbi:hypothetical protein Ocin01_12856 [Orchesella cincta]|uniref:Uncharacterized protein n=1 Tax=Orchesella cincta TaxID=48709 RepID=A0A1D2MLA9_ORCCI|nr:hypothetical protein Ocin01_12856 [Orchesella cincta]
MALYKFILLAILLVGVCDAGFKAKRSPKPADSAPKKEDWTPVSTPQEFTVMVDDNINKADQFRHETWKPGGIIEGEYASPTRDGKWLKVNYRADKEGFHVLSSKVVSESELNQPAGGAASDHQAKIETHVNGKDIAYTVKEDDLKKAKQDSSKHAGL